MLGTQPDYTAVQHFTFSEGVGGFGSSSKIMKMGNRLAEVRDDTIFINEPNKPLIKIFPKRREYVELQMEETNDFAVSPEELAKRDDTVFKPLGTEKIGAYSCIKIEVSYMDEKVKLMRFLFWVAPTLKNLVIKSEMDIGDRVKMFTLLENVRLNVDEKLFRIPAGFKKVVDPTYMKPLQGNRKRH